MRQSSQREITRFMRQFATLFNAGISPLRSCDILISSQPSPVISSLLHQLKNDLLAGKSLHTAFSQYPDISPLSRQLIRIGEHTGTLDHMLGRIADHLEQRQLLNKQLQQALFYPAITLAVATGITLIILFFIIPRFAELFDTAAISLPLWTRWIFQLSFLLRHHAVLFIALPVLCYWLMTPPQLRLLFCNVGARLPFFRMLQTEFALARFIRHLAICFSAGIPLPEAVDLCMTGPQSFQVQLQQIKHRLLSGNPLHDTMRTLSSFPVFLVQLIKVGEESGKLEEILHRIAHTLETTIQQHIQRFTQLLEPLIILTLGVVIGGLVIGMYLPVFQLGSAL